MLEGSLDGALGNLVEGNALNARRRVRIFFLLLFSFAFLGVAVGVEFEGKVRGNRFTFPVRVRREIDGIHRPGQLLQLGQNFFFSGDDDVIGFKVVVGIHAQRALRQIFDVAVRGLDGKSLSQIFLDGFRLGWRFDND